MYHDNWRERGGARRAADCNEQREAERPLLLPKLIDGKHLMVRSTSLFKGGPCTLEVPEVLGSYSVDSEKKVRFDDSAMSVLSEKYILQENEHMQVRLDLNRGKHQYREFTTTTTDIFRQFLQWILKNQKELTAESSPNKLMADFVVARTILKRIMEAPYVSSMNFGIMLFAQYFKGSIYIDFPVHGDDDEEEEDGEEEGEVIEVDPILGVYGHKFEQYMTGGDPNEVVHCNSEFRCVLKQHLSELTLLYHTSTDAVDQTCHQDDFKDMSSFVSLKACIERTIPHKQRNFRKYSLCGWWCESQLSGIPRVLKGTRSYDGIVHTLEMLQTADLPDLAEGSWRAGRDAWRGEPGWEAERPETELVDGNHLMVRSTDLYQGGPRTLEIPHVLGSYSVDKELKVKFDDSLMSVLSKEYIPRRNRCLQVELDLNRGWHRVNGFTGTSAESYRQFLQWILKNQKKLKAEGSSDKLVADFVCSRGILKNIMQAPYARFERMNLTVLAQYFKGSVYVAYQYEVEEEEKGKEKCCLIEIYGHKFEQYMTGGDPDQVVECNCQFRCVVKQHLNEITLMYSANTHAIDQSLPPRELHGHEQLCVAEGSQRIH
ncbi:decapping and exoribonuclease protein-like isoform X2 [Scylla paramamosain]|uniref:decapping and exoribonuclease protein-like isoform X2 n=1 Tax=Scylla paramamosain TaxID=85552 RepID=UPI003082C5F7